MVGIEKGETFTSEDHLLCYHVSRALDDYLEEKRYEFVYHQYNKRMDVVANAYLKSEVIGV